MTSSSAFAARTGIVGVVVTNESNMVSCFPEAVNLNGSDADMFSDVAGPSSIAVGDFFELSDRSNKTSAESLALLAAILDLSVATTPILPFGVCYVITHIKGLLSKRTSQETAVIFKRV